MIVTFDLFSALTDSRSGGSAAFDRVAEAHGWNVDGEMLYDRWDAHNKGAQRDCASWVPYRELSERALAATYRDLDLDGDAHADVTALEASVADWPLWPDVPGGLEALARSYRLGVLSNVDDSLFAATKASALIDSSYVLTSQRLQAYKPNKAIYERAASHADGLVHVASSARDVRGALQAGIATIRLVRPGHALDPQGPVPTHEVSRVNELPEVLAQLRRR